jgi:bilirubin oxidase
LRAKRFQADFYDLGTYRDQDLLTLATTNDVPAQPVELPSKLRSIADLGPAEARQQVRFDEIRDLCTRSGASIAFLINGRRFDMDRVDLVSIAGRVEEWEIFNNTAMPHPFHIHGTQFQVVSHRLDGDPIPAPYRAWVDTVLVPVAQTITIKVRQELPGRRMFHCHILQHEDNCMMAILDVQPATG